MSEPIQIIDGQHVDQRKLIRLLQQTYGQKEGENNFRVEAWTTLNYMHTTIIPNTC